VADEVNSHAKESDTGNPHLSMTRTGHPVERTGDTRGQGMQRPDPDQKRKGQKKHADIVSGRAAIE
jgi:hypothetical protein